MNTAIWVDEVSFEMRSNGCQKLSPSLTVDLLSTHLISQVTFWTFYGDVHHHQAVEKINSKVVKKKKINAQRSKMSEQSASGSGSMGMSQDDQNLEGKFLKVTAGGANEDELKSLYESDKDSVSIVFFFFRRRRFFLPFGVGMNTFSFLDLSNLDKSLNVKVFYLN